MKKITLNVETPTLSFLSSQWLTLCKNSLKPNTFQKYKYHIEKCINNSFIANKLIDDISSADLIIFSQRLFEYKLSNNTINDILFVFGLIIKFSHDYYNNTLISVPYVKHQQREMRVLSTKEQQILEEFLVSDMDVTKFGILLALYTGLRIGELCALQWKDVENGCINVYKTMYRIKSNDKTVVVTASQKTISSFRTIPVPDFLNRYIELFRNSSDSNVLGTERTPKVEPRLMQLRFKKITDICNFKSVTSHTLRHTFATRCVECGFDIKSLSEILGHSNVKTTLNNYIHSSMEQKQLNMNKLERIAM